MLKSFLSVNAWVMLTKIKGQPFHVNLVQNNRLQPKIHWIRFKKCMLILKKFKSTLKRTISIFLWDSGVQKLELERLTGSYVNMDYVSESTETMLVEFC